MANYSTTKASIDANVIPYNNAQLITGEKMNSVLKEIVDNMGGQGYLFKGIASPSDPAITTDARVFFFATEPGTYTNKGGVVVNSGELAIITYDTIWNKSVVNYGLTDDELAKLQDLPTDAELTTLLGDKVDKVSGKGLSTNDYTDADKAIVDGVDTTYAKKDGYYSQMGVGVADNLAGKGDGVPAEFTRRTTGGDASVADGVATLKAIKGKTIVWNQLVDINAWTQYGCTKTIVGNKVSLHASDTQQQNYMIFYTDTEMVGIVGHKYLVKIKVDLGTATEAFIKLSNASSIPIYDGNWRQGGTYTFILNVTTFNTRTSITFLKDEYTETDASFEMFEITDLTLMFGAGNEPSTVEEFESLFPNDYYPYNAGQLLSFNGTDIVTDGFNQFDGTKARVFGGKAYYINGTYTTLKFAESLDGEQTDITPSSHLFTPSNDGYIFATGVSADFCINLSWSGYRNGQYEPYWKETKSLPSLSAFDVAYTGADGEQHTEGGLKSAGSVYDEQTFIAVAGGLKVKNTRRIGVVDLGTPNWSYNSNLGLFYAINSDIKNYARGAGGPCICRNYESARNVSYVAWANFPDKHIASGSGYISASQNETTIVIKDSAYTDVASFKAAMAGVLLFYELAEPVETDGEVYNPNYRVSDFGTETILPEGVDEAGVPKTAPFNGSIVYGLNAVDTLRNLPKDYISKDSMDAILAAFVSAGIIAGYTLTFDATSGKYNCTITPNS